MINKLHKRLEEDVKYFNKLNGQPSWQDNYFGFLNNNPTPTEQRDYVKKLRKQAITDFMKELPKVKKIMDLKTKVLMLALKKF